MPDYRDGLFPSESEIARRLCQSPEGWREMAPLLEREGLPHIDPLFKGRYWPAVKAWLDSRHLVGRMAAEVDGEENWDGETIR